MHLSSCNPSFNWIWDHLTRTSLGEILLSMEQILLRSGGAKSAVYIYPLFFQYEKVVEKFYILYCSKSTMSMLCVKKSE